MWVRRFWRFETEYSSVRLWMDSGHPMSAVPSQTFTSLYDLRSGGVFYGRKVRKRRMNV